MRDDDWSPRRSTHKTRRRSRRTKRPHTHILRRTGSQEDDPYITILSSWKRAWRCPGIRALRAPRVIAPFAIPESVRLFEKSRRQRSIRWTPEWRDQTDETQCMRNTACYSVALQCPSVAAAPLGSGLVTREPRGEWRQPRKAALRGPQPFANGDVQTRDRYGGAKNPQELCSRGFFTPLLRLRHGWENRARQSPTARHAAQPEWFVRAIYQRSGRWAGMQPPDFIALHHDFFTPDRFQHGAVLFDHRVTEFV